MSMKAHIKIKCLGYFSTSKYIAITIVQLSDCIPKILFPFFLFERKKKLRKPLKMPLDVNIEHKIDKWYSDICNGNLAGIMKMKIAAFPINER